MLGTGDDIIHLDIYVGMCCLWERVWHKGRPKEFTLKEYSLLKEFTLC